MAKISTGALITDITGSLGPVVFRGSDLGKQVYIKTYRKKEATDQQIIVRRAVARVRWNWSLLLESDRQSWFQLAAYVRTNKGFNGQYPRRAYSLFHEMNFWPAMAGVDPVLTAPSWPLQKSQIGGVTHLTTAGMFIWYAAGWPGAAHATAAFFMRPCLNVAQKSKFVPWKLIITKVDSVGVFEYVPEYENFFKLPYLQQLYQYKIVGWDSLSFPNVYETGETRVQT